MFMNQWSVQKIWTDNLVFIPPPRTKIIFCNNCNYFGL